MLSSIVASVCRIGFLKDRFLLRAWEDFTRPAGHAQHATSPPLTLTVAAAPSGGNWEASPACSMVQHRHSKLCSSLSWPWSCRIERIMLTDQWTGDLVAPLSVTVGERAENMCLRKKGREETGGR